MKILEKLIKAFKRKNLNALKNISNQAIERAAFTENSDLANVSIVAYALYKLLSKSHVLASEEWTNFANNVVKNLEQAISMYNKGEDVGEFFESEIIKDITRIDESLGNYVNDIIEKARVKQASRIYAMGLSVNKAISLTGADKYKLMQYIGSTVIHDRPYTSSKTVLERYEIAKKTLGDANEQNSV